MTAHLTTCMFVMAVALPLWQFSLAQDTAAGLKAKMAYSQQLESFDDQLRNVQTSAEKESLNAEQTFKDAMKQIQEKKGLEVEKANKKFNVVQEAQEKLIKQAEEEMDAAKSTMDKQILIINSRPTDAKTPKQFELTAPHQVSVIDNSNIYLQKKNCAWCDTTKQLEIAKEVKVSTDAYEAVASSSKQLIEQAKVDIKKAQEARDKTIADASAHKLEEELRVTKAQDDAKAASMQKKNQAEAKHATDIRLVNDNKEKADETARKRDDKLKATQAKLDADSAKKTVLDAVKIALVAKDELKQEDESLSAANVTGTSNTA